MRDKEKEGEREGEILHLLVYSPVARTEPSGSQEPGPSSRSPTRLTGTKSAVPSSAAFLMLLAGNWTRNGATWMWASTPMEQWLHRWRLLPSTSQCQAQCLSPLSLQTTGLLMTPFRNGIQISKTLYAFFLSTSIYGVSSLSDKFQHSASVKTENIPSFLEWEGRSNNLKPWCSHSDPHLVEMQVW